MTTPTPRTDAEDHWRVDQSPCGTLYVDAVRADFARDLEQECERLRAALQLLRQYANDSNDHQYGTLSTSLVGGIVDEALEAK